MEQRPTFPQPLQRWLSEAEGFEHDHPVWAHLEAGFEALRAVQRRLEAEHESALRVLRPLEGLQEFLPEPLEVFSGRSFGDNDAEAALIVERLEADAKALASAFTRKGDFATITKITALGDRSKEHWLKLQSLLVRENELPPHQRQAPKVRLSRTSSSEPEVEAAEDLTYPVSRQGEVEGDRLKEPEVEGAADLAGPMPRQGEGQEPLSEDAPQASEPEPLSEDGRGEAASTWESQQVVTEPCLPADHLDGAVVVSEAHVASPGAGLREPATNWSASPPATPSTDAAVARLGDSPVGGVEPPRLPQDERPSFESRVERPTLRSWDEVREDFWVRPDGQVEQAPWKSNPDEFASRIEREQMNALEERDFRRLEVFVRTLEKMGRRGVTDSRDLPSLQELLTNTGRRGRDAERGGRLREALERSENDPRLSFTLLLEVLAPSPASPLSVPDRDALLDLGQTPLFIQDLVKIAHTMSFQQREPLDMLRQASEAVDRARESEELKQTLVESRKRFDTWFRSFRRNGRQLSLPHCRNAWRKFIADHFDELRPALTEQPFGSVRDIDALGDSVASLVQKAEKIAEDDNVRYTERGKFDSSVSVLVEESAKIIALARRLSAPPPTEADLKSLRRAYDAFRNATVTSPAERALRSAVALAVAQDSFEAKDIYEEFEVHRNPGVMEFIEVGATEPHVAADEHPRVAGLVLDSASTTAATWVEAVEACDRRDLLAFAPARWSVRADAREEEALRRQEVVRAAEAELRPVFSDLDDLADPMAVHARRVRDEAPEPTPRHAHLIAYWYEQLGADLGRYVSRCIEEFRDKGVMQLPTEERAEALEDIDRRRLARLVLRFNTESGAHEPGDRRGERLTGFRSEAVRSFSRLNPTDFSHEAAELVRLWRKRPTEHNEAQSLRNSFYRFLAGEKRGDSKRQSVERALEAQRVVIPSQGLRDFIQRQGLGATFVPQLSSFANIVIVSSRESLRDERRAVKEILALASQQGPRDAVIVLCPGLDKEVRADLREHLWGNERTIALVDDVDLHRLLQHGGGVMGLLALFEILLEQSDPRGLSPFESGDGQDIKVEMFVGRRDEVKALAESSNFSRIFSGRKLGKSAMLKYLEKFYTDRRNLLPSGNRLEVLYVNVGGIDKERQVVTRVIDAVSARLELSESIDPGYSVEEPVDRLVEFCTSLAGKVKGVSFLVVLDEADGFVESQVRDYPTKMERCLSFKMAKTIPGTAKDSQDLPRVRFLLAGYRRTNTTKGAWANAGQVKTLPPLSQDEARALFEGPFARMGYDVRDFGATVAHRCGRQPAVILKLGKTLLERLAAKPPALDGGRPKVSRQDVLETFSSRPMQDEIFTIIENNFQGNDMAATAFFALAKALEEVAPAALAGAPEAMLRVIKEVDGDLDWFQGDDEARLQDLRWRVDELIERNLVAEKDECVRLMFPHFLPVVVERNLGRLIAERIAAVRTVGDERQLLDLDILPQKQMTDVRYSRSEPEFTSIISAIVVGSSWPESLSHERGGLRARMGLEHSSHDSEFFEDLLGTTLAASVDDGSTADRTAIPVFMGGMELIREALRLDGHVLEIVGQQRFSQLRIRWWFNFIRSLEMGDASAYQEIYARTSGIPLLVRAFDAELHHEVGETVSASDFAEALERFDSKLPALAARLVRAENRGAHLSERETTILRVVARMALENGGEFEVSDIEDFWEDYGGTKRAFDSENGDLLAVDMLATAGFIVKSGPDRIVLGSEDALHRLLELIPTK